MESRAAVLGADWSSSKDVAWTTSGDAAGFHILVAEANTGYTWRTAATLSEPGFDSDAWIGNTCLTGSGRRVVVVYAPRTFTNEAKLMARGGFTAVVDLLTGDVRKIDLQGSLSYYNPGCGTGESAVVTQSGGEDKTGTRLVVLDAATGGLAKPIELEGQVTSAVPLPNGAVAAADGARIVTIGQDGQRRTLVTTEAVPQRLTPDGGGGLVFVDRAAGTGGSIKWLSGAQFAVSHPRLAGLGDGPLTRIGISRGAGGQVYLTGEVRRGGRGLPKFVHQLGGTSKHAQISTLGQAVLTKSAWADGANGRVATDKAGGIRRVAIEMNVTRTGRNAAFLVEPDADVGAYAAKGRVPSPALAAPRGAVGANASPTDPVESERTCSVPRNDARNQAMQPKPRQVEWAVDQAIMWNLDSHATRPANWKNLGMPFYRPQTLFPPGQPLGGGRVPAQVMLGITAQESNMWQASRHAVPGVTSNPLIGNYYGIDYYNDDESDDWNINWAEADCGYGVTQVTDHMRLAGRENGRPRAWDYQVQRAVALDYAANIAAGLQILIEKWNQTRSAGMTVNDGNWSSLESWYFALWAYNSGFYPDKGDGSPWGVGWANNPANPEWDAGRLPFMEFSYADAAHPQDWPYQEKVLGFAGHPPELLEAPNTPVHGFRPAWWLTEGDRQTVKTPEDLFCSTVNSCDPGMIGDGAQNNPGAGPCTRSDFKCWWHQPVRWKTCPDQCGYELVRFDPPYPEQADGTAYPPNCSLQGAPPGALIIDDQPDGTPAVRPGCARPWNNAGSFSFTFTNDAGTSLYPGKVDTHHIGGGFGGHFYFGHTRTAGTEGQRLAVTGTWTLGSPRNEWARVAVHLPDHGAHTQQAKYEIDTGSGVFTKVRYINQKRLANNWVSLGVYRLNGVPRVRLGTLTDDGIGSDDVAWDAVAFQPLPGKPRHLVAALGDSYASGEGAGNYYAESDSDHGSGRWNACRRSRDSWARKTWLPHAPAPLGQIQDTWGTDAELGFVACSGAATSNVWDASYNSSWQPFRFGQHHEQKQVRSGVLDENTTLVTLTLGGNDGGAFTNAFTECAYLAPNCDDDPTFLPRYEALIDRMVPNLRRTLLDIAARAPNAQIVLMGYPEPFSRTFKCTGSLTIYLPEYRALAWLAFYINTAQAGVVTELARNAVRIAYADPIDTFAGHGACDDPEWIHNVSLGPRGDGDFHMGDPEAGQACPPAWLPGDDCLSRESFHPKSAGTTAYADLLRLLLVNIGYQGSG